MDDRDLVRRCLSNEAGAWDSFMSCYSPLISEAVGRCFSRYGRTIDPSRVQDIVQESFLRLLRDDKAALRRYRWDNPLSHFLVCAATNCAIDALRGPRQPFPVGDGEALERLAADGRFAGDESARLRSEDRRERVHAALAKLSGRERLALQFAYWDGLPARAIGRLLRLEEGAAWTLLTRARQRLRELLRNVSSLCL